MDTVTSETCAALRDVAAAAYQDAIAALGTPAYAEARTRADAANRAYVNARIAAASGY